MKIIFLARELDSSKIIADLLLKNQWIDRVVFESGGKARSQKLRRMLKRKPWWRIFLLPLDILFLLYMTRKANQHFAGKFHKPPEVLVDYRVDDVNDSDCVTYLQKEAPDLLLIYGTAILKKPVLAIPKVGVINIHGGLVPKYRNVHGEFWAVAHKRFDELGTSLLWTDEGVDSGDIVAQRPLGLTQPVSVSEAKLLVFDDTLNLIRELMPQIRRGEIPRQKQPAFTGSVFQTPGFIDWLKFRLKL